MSVVLTLVLGNVVLDFGVGTVLLLKVSHSSLKMRFS